MDTVRIYDTPDFTLDSSGNGFSYTLTRKRDNGSVFVHGDDASTFRENIELFETRNPDELSNRMLQDLWDSYS